MINTTNKLTIIRGDTAEITVTFKDNDDVALDLTNKTVFFTAKKSKYLEEENDNNASIKKDITVHTDPTSGITTIELSPSDTDIDTGDYCYDLQIKDLAGSIVSVDRKIMEIINDVTKRIT